MREVRGELLAHHGFWRVGGPMQRFCVVESAEELRSLGRDVHILGNGSNLLIPDAGLAGTTVRLAGSFRDLTVLNDSGVGVSIRVGAGLLNTVLLSRLDKLGLGGLGCLAGVPGTMGGAVAMNAGTALGELAEVLESIEGPDGEVLTRAELPMRYRDGGLPAGLLVTTATLHASRSSLDFERISVATHLARRKATQPLELPSCGSVFRNPPGDHAGRLIESVGLRGLRHGGAQISPKHANFIVNVDHAMSLDVMRCIRQAWDTVLRETGIRLTPEVHVLGHWPAELWPFPADPPSGAAHQTSE